MTQWVRFDSQRDSVPWPENGDDVLVALLPWKDGERPYVASALFHWEGKDSWRPTFRGSDGDKLKMAYTWCRKPDPPPVPEDYKP